jgi:peptidoglycan/LPS O-acetylase OafA/YrhL
VLAALAVTTMTVRFYSPIDHWVGLLGFIQVAYADVPRDLFFFALGIYGYRNGLFVKPAHEPWKMHLTVAAILALVYVTGEVTSLANNARMKGYVWNGVFSFWETFYCYSMCAGLLSLFRERVGKTNFIFKALGKASFGAYVLHVPVVVLFQYGVNRWHLPVVIEFFTVSVFSVAGSYGLVQLAHTLKARVSQSCFKKICGAQAGNRPHLNVEKNV